MWFFYNNKMKRSHLCVNNTTLPFSAVSLFGSTSPSNFNWNLIHKILFSTFLRFVGILRTSITIGSPSIQTYLYLCAFKLNVVIILTQDHSLWLTISLWPIFAIVQLNVFKTISFDSIRYFSMLFWITGLWPSSNDTIFHHFFTT